MTTTIRLETTNVNRQPAKNRWRRLAKRAILVTVVIAFVAFLLWPRHGIDREVNDTVRVPFTSPEGYMWTTENAFPNLKFFEPTSIVYVPDGSDRFFVLERRGTIQAFQNDAGTKTKTQLVDFSDHVVRTEYEDNGALNLVLHPEFGRPDSPNRGYIYVFYTANVGGDCYDRLSRFTIPDGSQTADPTSELVLIDQRDRNLWHNGSGMAFGPDGFLYVGVGDEGELKDYFGNGQRIDRNLFSGMLRIDVDRRGDDVSHQPRRQPADGTTANYFIPNDNPFVGTPGALEEFWAIGLRNPHRICFDPAKGELWTGDVGQDLREEVNIVVRGGNYQWSYAEGSLPFADSYLKGRKPAGYLGAETRPLFEYAHVNMNNCVIGGFVYRGDDLYDLDGHYIFGDNGSGRIWALQRENDGNVRQMELCAINASGKTGLSSFGLDADGEVLLLILGEGNTEAGTVHRLVEAPQGFVSAMPQLLSETGVFDDVAALRSAAGAFAYDVNSPVWTDGAVGRRWILLPGDGTDPDKSTDRIAFSENGQWTFPPGTVFIKHLEIPIDEANPSRTKRLETQLLVIQNDGAAYGVTYQWNEEGTDAKLLVGETRQTFEIKTADGGRRNQVWTFHSRENCLACHNKNAGYVLGVNTRQLNRDFVYSGVGGRNQLSEWSRGDMFVEPLAADRIADLPRLVAIDDHTADLTTRVRSYLDANCSHCHQPGGVRAGFDARFSTPLDKQNLIGGRLQSPTHLTNAKVVVPCVPSRSMIVHRMLHRDKQMPLMGVSRRDLRAIEVICQWIDSLPPNEDTLQVEVAAAGPPE